VNRHTVLSDPSFPVLKDFVLNHTGLAYYADKDEDLAMRIGRRLDALRVANCQLYLARLMDRGAGPAEMECLIGELTIGETYFFRQVEHFDLLKSTVIPALLRQNAAIRRLRVWSAGCATGEEPYSVAILLQREFGGELLGWDVTILATDINREFLERAKEGQYGEWSFRATPRQVWADCFIRQGKTWLLKPQYKKRVEFRKVNLAENNEIFRESEVFDLIFCRNVMIYFSRHLIARTIGRFWDALRPGGWLIVGHAEFDPEAYTRFTRVQLDGAGAYQRPQPGRAPEPSRPAASAFPSDPAWIAPSPAGGPAPSLRATRPARSSPLVPSLERVRELADRGALHAAAALGKQLTAMEPFSAAAHFTLGLILESALSCREAKEALRRAIYLDRNFALAHYHFATCLQTVGENAKARKSFLNTIQLLDELPPEQRLEHTDGLTVADLREMAKLHIEMLEVRGRAN
jgi:chemotaxis protein methyltransferase CheR